MRIDLDRIARILAENPPEDDCAGYYRQYEARYERLGPLVPGTRALLRAAFAPGMRVLDLGCGRGDTLLDEAYRFGHGVGLDASGDIMLARAREARVRRRIGNVGFVGGRADALPFADAAFDFVFTERGPLGRQDETLMEALRVLRPDGLLFVETIGERNSRETVAAFDPDSSPPESFTAQLDIERARFERHGVTITTLASRTATLRFPDLYEWLRFQCHTWNPPGRDRLTPDAMPAYERLLGIAGDAAGRIRITEHTIWIAGRKSGKTYSPEGPRRARPRAPRKA